MNLTEMALMKQRGLKDLNSKKGRQETGHDSFIADESVVVTPDRVISIINEAALRGLYVANIEYVDASTQVSTEKGQLVKVTFTSQEKNVFDGVNIDDHQEPQ